ncbi:hypothetical protein [Algoriphagus sp.]|uniref:hypothetical protein n=1 Tax=Algoriphagus sp. TaxID=1872435 RepID=UPI00391876FD
MPVEPLKETPLISGQIEILDYNVNFNIMAERDQTGKHLPKIVHQIILNGRNLNGHEFTTVDIRFRESKDIVTNPAGSTEKVIMDIPKTDFESFDWLLKKTIDSQNSDRKTLLMEYYSTQNYNEYHVTFFMG